ncbi:hypothetical protein Bca4012_074360 [Brassica carinata]|uniref:Replication protein A 70 kDa DNA-binding subunit B/D first OB fold domain-containing protein n=1 Tax=Brassica carinata TaxID=52824 RepID=A0A8X7UB37_BRACI|nr:hypothetical protein Bca52824_066639 [Brassica carinata]
MVVVDCNGVKIHASVKKDLVNQFDPQLSEGSSKIFINFSVGQSCGSYRTTNHQYTISFLETTRLEEPAAIPLALKNLVGKTYLFKVGIERENFLYSHDTYKVTKIITNDEIISEFDTKVYPKLPNLTYTGDNTVLSDAPEKLNELILLQPNAEGRLLLTWKKQSIRIRLQGLHVLLESRRKRLKKWLMSFTRKTCFLEAFSPFFLLLCLSFHFWFLTF